MLDVINPLKRYSGPAEAQASARAVSIALLLLALMSVGSGVWYMLNADSINSDFTSGMMRGKSGIEAEITRQHTSSFAEQSSTNSFIMAAVLAIIACWQWWNPSRWASAIVAIWGLVGVLALVALQPLQSWGLWSAIGGATNVVLLLLGVTGWRSAQWLRTHDTYDRDMVLPPLPLPAEHPFDPSIGVPLFRALARAARSPGATAELKRDFKTLCRYAGDGPRITPEAEARLVHYFVSYCAGGRAPSKRLQDNFAEIASQQEKLQLWAVPWDLASVFDRLLASDEEIQEMGLRQK